MKRTKLILIVLMFMAGCTGVFAQDGPAQEVQKLERAWLDAYEQNDEKAMTAIVADDFVITFPDGSMQTKAQILSMIKAPRPAGTSHGKVSY